MGILGPARFTYFVFSRSQGVRVGEIRSRMDFLCIDRFGCNKSVTGSI